MLKSKGGIGAIMAMALLPAAAVAQDVVKDALKDLPDWQIPDICAKDSAKSHCLALESRAWRTLSGGWVSLPDSVKKACLVTKGPATNNSWRVLYDCVDVEMEKSADKHAVNTRYTPGEPVPPPKSRPVAPAAPPPPPPPPLQPTSITVPPPILGMPTAPPPFAIDAETVAKRLAQAAPPAAPAASPAPAPTPPPVVVAVPPPILGMPMAPPPFALDAEQMAKQKAAADAAEAKRKADEEARKRAEADAARKAAAEAEAARKAAAEAEAKRKADEERKLAEAEAARKAAAEADARRKADQAREEARKLAEAETARRTAVAKACEDDLARIATDGTIRFTFGSAALDRISNATLDKLAAATNQCPSYTVRVEAHTDAVGDDDFNLNLSQRRAQSVVTYLIKAGVPESLIVAEGFGKTRPIGDNGTTEGRAQNRRIEFKVVPR